MPIKYLKKSPKTSSTDDNKTKDIVQKLLNDLEKSREDGCKDLTKKFDKYEGEIIVSEERIDEIKKSLDQKTKDDVQFSFIRELNIIFCFLIKRFFNFLYSFFRNYYFSIILIKFFS